MMLQFVFLSVLLPAVIQGLAKRSTYNCPVVCPYSYRPVCGTNGKTYSNECLMKQDRECNGKDISIANYGVCKEVTMTNKKKGPDCTSPKETGMCRAYYQKWYFDTETNSCKDFVYGGCRGNENRYNSHEECEATCVSACPKRCPNLYKPVCASDGNTYANQCQLQVSVGCWNEQISFMYSGECKGPK